MVKLIAKEVIKSYTRKVYANKMDEVEMIGESGHVGLYINKKTGITFPAEKIKIIEFEVLNIENIKQPDKPIKQSVQEKSNPFNEPIKPKQIKRKNSQMNLTFD